MKNLTPFERRFLIGAMIVAAILSLVPMLIGVLTAPNGWQFLGYPFATDDHMVYAAWMRQAQDGNFFFDNRFATDAQPGLTVNVYFFVLGLISKVFGIPWTTALAKAAFSALFVFLASKLVRRLTDSTFAIHLALVFIVFGAGFGFILWHQFGEAITKESPPFIGGFLHSRLPTDVWQPEGFVFPSMLTNSLFMVSLCLIAFVLLALLDAETSWRSAGYGALGMLLLSNIHTYDALLVGMIAFGFLVALAVQKRLTGIWILRGLAIFAGAIPSGLWIWRVLQADPVFAARANTLTFSPNFREVFFGYGLLLVLGIGWLIRRKERDVQLIGAGLAAINIAVLLFVGNTPTEGYFLTPLAFGILIASTLAAVALCSDEEPAISLVIAWALIGIAAIYFPALFQRKLAMGLSIPWAIMAALFVGDLLENVEAEPRKMVAGLASLVVGLSSIFWLQREIHFIKQDVGRTTVHALYLPPEVNQMMKVLNSASGGRKVLLALPGMPDVKADENGITDPDGYSKPLWSDMNAIFSGFTGVYSYAGHWSETPDYVARRKETTKFFFNRTTSEYRKSLIEKSGANYALGPTKEAFGFAGNSGYVDLRTIGDVVSSGKEFVLVKLDPNKL